MTDRYNVLAIIRMGDANVYYHLEPIAMNDAVESVFIVRPEPENRHRRVSNSLYYEIVRHSTPGMLWAVLRTSLKISRRQKVDYIVSFTANPYGLIAIFLGWLTRTPVHIGCVGSDWYRDCKSWYGWFLNLFLRRADLITVTGGAMKADMLDHGYPKENIHQLPHSVDIHAYQNLPYEARTFDCLYVGRLIELKRVDLIVQAVANIKKSCPAIRLGIVGEGPLRPDLVNQVKQLDITENVEFFGYVDNPCQLYSKSRIVVIASSREGFPFSLVEGMAAGAVPVCSDVGTISDHIENGKNGVLLPYGDVGAMSLAIQRLLSDRNYYDTIQKAVVGDRARFSLEHARDKWKSWLSTGA